MYEQRERETDFGERRESQLEAREQPPTAHHAWKIIGGAVLVLTAFTLISQWSDIKRYARMVRM